MSFQEKGKKKERKLGIFDGKITIKFADDFKMNRRRGFGFAMKYLLDTHTFLWAVSQSKDLPAKVCQAIKNPGNDVFVSAVTFWEIA